MIGTRKAKNGRKGPTESATLFAVGTVRIGNDGKDWIIAANKNGIHRWTPVRSYPNSNKTRKIKNRTATPYPNHKPSANDKAYQKWLNKEFHIDVHYTRGCGPDNWEGVCNGYLPEDKLRSKFEWTMFDPNKEKGENNYSLGFCGPNATRDAALAYITSEYEKLVKKGAVTKFKIVPNDRLNEKNKSK